MLGLAGLEPASRYRNLQGALNRTIRVVSIRTTRPDEPGGTAERSELPTTRRRDGRSAADPTALDSQLSVAENQWG
jgi:hypothetical protein